jgi:hypothetical protein
MSADFHFRLPDRPPWLKAAGASCSFRSNGVERPVNGSQLPALKSLAELADREPVIVIDTREQEQAR